jgi:hypothetical protein
MSLVAHIGPLSPFTYAGMAGLSLTACFGIFKLLRHFWCLHRGEVGRNAELSTLRRSLSATRSDAEVKDEALGNLKSEVGGMKSRLEDLQILLESTQRRNQMLEEQVEQQAEEERALRDEVRQMKAKHAQAVQLLETRTLELKGAEAFLTKADALSGADIIGMLNTLNSEIYQTAALVAESFEFKQKNRRRGWREVDDVGEGDEETMGKEGDVERGDEQEEAAEVYASATEILGSRMVELLKTTEHHEDPTIIQIAFQAGMSAYTNWILTSWYFDDPEDEHLLSEIYMRVREAGQ